MKEQLNYTSVLLGLKVIGAGYVDRGQ